MDDYENIISNKVQIWRMPDSNTFSFHDIFVESFISFYAFMRGIHINDANFG